MKLFPGFVLVVLFGVIFSSCEKHDHDHDHEVITTLVVKLTPTGGGNMLSYSFDDPDGPGGQPPVIQNIQLAPNTTYNVSLELLNKTTNPATNLTGEIAAESISHRFYYEPSAGSNITVTNLDNDTNGVPLGLNSVWTTGTPANGTIRITLRHYTGNPPNKAASDPVDSNKSSTDIQVNFNTIIQ